MSEDADDDLKFTDPFNGQNDVQFTTTNSRIRPEDQAYAMPMKKAKHSKALYCLCSIIGIICYLVFGYGWFYI